MPNYFKTDWLEEWKKERKMGRSKWVLTHGVGFLVIATLVDAFVNSRKVWEMPINKVIITLLIYTAGGIGYGLFSWWFNERKLARENKKKLD